MLKLVIGVLSIPIAVGATYALYRNMLFVRTLAGSLSFFLWGVAAYATLHLLFYKPTYLYVLGHEAVHAGTAWLFGGKVKSFKVSKEGGSVGTDKSNAVIELSPYFMPIYAIIVALISFVVASSYTVNSHVFIFLIGLLSVAIGFFNLLPIPLLDGGHAVMYVWEGVSRRKLTPVFDLAGALALLGQTNVVTPDQHMATFKRPFSKDEPVVCPSIEQIQECAAQNKACRQRNTERLFFALPDIIHKENDCGARN